MLCVDANVTFTLAVEDVRHHPFIIVSILVTGCTSIKNIFEFEPIGSHQKYWTLSVHDKCSGFTSGLISCVCGPLCYWLLHTH